MQADYLCVLWDSLGIQQGDTILVHSSLARLIRYFRRTGQRVQPGDIIESLIERTGHEGCLVFPLFNYGFTRGEPFDFNSTPSEMGVLTETARQHPLAVRTGHPVFSFAAVGGQSRRFRGLNNHSAFGKDSPFSILHEANGKIMIIGLPDQYSMTFYHYVEECHGVPYRYHKEFCGRYTDTSGISSTACYDIFVRDIGAGVVNHVNPMGEILWEKGVYTGQRPDQECGIRVAPARQVFDETSKVILAGRAENTLYRIEK